MNKKALTFDDILLIPQYSNISSRKDVDISSKTPVLSLELPILSANMDTITEAPMVNWMASKGASGILHRFMSIEKNVEEFKKCPVNTFVSVGVTDKEYERFLALYDVGARHFCIDIAHGHSLAVADMIFRMKIVSRGKENPVIMAGNVATSDGARYLKDVGADIVKVGIGPGSVCSTRIKTGFGVPQLSAIEECSKAGIPIVADGGIRTPGDVVKALAFGADFVMVGGMLSGTHFSPGLVKNFILDNGELFQVNPYKIYRGMASKEVADDKLGGLSEWKTAEGVSVTVPYKNKKESDAIIADIIGGLRSGLTYAGARNLKELREKVKYVEISNAGLLESHPHKKG